MFGKVRRKQRCEMCGPERVGLVEGGVGVHVAWTQSDNANMDDYDDYD